MFNSKCISIDIGNQYAKCAVGTYKNNLIKIDQLILEKVPEGIIKNGMIIDVDGMTDFIRSIIDKNKVKVKEISFSIFSNKVFQRELEVSIVDNDSDRKNLIAYEIEQFIPDEIENSIIQHKIIDEIDYGETKKHKVFVAVISKDIVDQYYQVVKNLKLKPSILDIHSNTIHKLLELDTKNKVGHDFEEKNTIVLDIGYKTINACIYERSVFKFCREILSGLNHMIELMENQTYEELLNIKYDEVTSEAYPQLKDEINYWIQEISKIRRLYLSSANEINLDKIYLCGGGAQLQFISEALKQELEVKVEVISPLDVLDLKDSVSTEALPLFMNAIGNLVKE